MIYSNEKSLSVCILCFFGNITWRTIKIYNLGFLQYIIIDVSKIVSIFYKTKYGVKSTLELS